MLAARAAGTIRIDTQILVTNFHIDITLDIRHDIQGYEGCLTLTLCIERGDTYQTVDALLGLQITVSILTVDLKGHRLDTGLVSVQIVQHFHCEAVALRPACIHAVQHARPVAALGAARACVQLQNCVVSVIFSGQQGLDGHGIQLGCKGLQLRLDLRHQIRVIFLISHLNQCLNVLVLLLQGVIILCLVL